MDIADIRQKAVPYYACFIARLLNKDGASLTLERIRTSSWVDSEPHGFYLLDDLKITELALDFLEESFVLKLISDEFAPRIVVRHPNYSDNISALYRSEDTVFGRYLLAGDGRAAWLEEALRNIKQRLNVLDVEENIDQGDDDVANDVEDSTSNDNSWSPIPLDRNDPKQVEATKALDVVIEELRGDNGYATRHPEEKADVQDKLLAARKRLTEDAQISWMYLREFALKPLAILVKRYGGAAIGVSASAAKDAFTSWLKTKGVSFLDDLFK